MRKLPYYLTLLSFFIVTSGTVRAAEHTERPKLAPFPIDYWGSDQHGKTLDELKGEFHILFFLPVAIQNSTSADTGQAINEYLEMYAQAFAYAKEHFTDAGIYFQVVTSPQEDAYKNEAGLRTLVKTLNIPYPVASSQPDIWKRYQCMTVDGSLRQNGVFLIDPFGRIAARTKPNYSGGLNEIEMPSAVQLREETVDYWLTLGKHDLEKAEQFYAKEKLPEAYKLYQPIAARLATLAPDAMPVQRMHDIETRARASMLQALANTDAATLDNCYPAFKRVSSAYKNTTLATAADNLLAMLKKLKLQPEMLTDMRLAAALALARAGQPEAARQTYAALAGLCPENKELQAELQLRLQATSLPKDLAPVSDATGQALVDRGVELWSKVEAMSDLPTSANSRQQAVPMLLAAAEHLLTAMLQMPDDLPTLQQQVAQVRAKLFWLGNV